MKKQSKPEEKRVSEQLLRDSAEDKLRGSSDTSSKMKEKSPEKLLHELQVHQIELEMQNEELCRAQFDLLESRQRFADLYDFAPVGYFTFSHESLIKEVNLTGATFLGVARQKLINKRFRPFIAPSDLDTWDQHFVSVLWEGGKQSRDLTLNRQDGSIFFAGLESIRVEVSWRRFEVHTIVTDITERRQMEEALRKREKQFKSLYDNAAGGIFQMTPEGRLITANRVFGRMFGYESPEEVIDTVTNIAHQIFANPDDKKMIIDMLKERESLRNYECQMRRKDGFIFWGSINARFTETVDAIPCFEGLIIDVSKRRQAEEKLRESEELFRSYLEHAPDGVYMSDLGGVFLYGNRKAEEILGYPREELIGKNLLETNILSGNSLNKAVRLLQSNIEGKPTGPDEIELISKEGRSIPVEINTSVVQRMGQKIVLAFVRDITERRQAEDDLRKSEERYRTILEDIDEGYFENDLAGNFTFVNDAECRDLGYSREELIGMNYRQYSDEATAKNLYELFYNIYNTGKPVKRFLEQFISKDGTHHFNEVSASLIRDAKGKPIGFRGVSTDITERKRAEEELRLSEERFRRIFDEGPVGMILVNPDYTIVTVNKVFCGLLGYNKQELVGSKNYRSHLRRRQREK